jgi:hypothetical protein
MYCRDPQALAAPTKRICLYRRVVAFFPLCTLAAMFILEMLHDFPQVSLAVRLAGYLTVLALAACAFAGFILLLAFQGGVITCPVCGAAYCEPKIGRIGIFQRPECVNCGYNILTGHRQGDF